MLSIRFRTYYSPISDSCQEKKIPSAITKRKKNAAAWFVDVHAAAACSVVIPLKIKSAFSKTDPGGTPLSPPRACNYKIKINYKDPALFCNYFHCLIQKAHAVAGGALDGIVYIL